MMDTPELELCPYCGGEASIHIDSYHSTGVSIGCQTVGCFGYMLWNETEREAAAHWNTRAKDAEIAALRDYAREATIALTELTTGGSEFFAGNKLGFYKADIPRCVENIKERAECRHRLGVALGKSEAQDEIAALKDKLAKAVEGLVHIYNAPSEMIWGEDTEVRECLNRCEAIAEATLADLTNATTQGKEGGE